MPQCHSVGNIGMGTVAVDIARSEEPYEFIEIDGQGIEWR
jgi:hypothetical protein